MWKLTKSFRFEAAHRLPAHGGKCKRLHGHDWKLVVVLESDTLEQEGPGAGMVMDFYDLKQRVQPIVEDLDHYFLNDLPGLENPTSEVLARWIYNRLVDRVPMLAAVIIEETEGSTCEFRP